MTRISFILSLILILFPATAQTKIITFQEQYTYDASEADSKLTCRAISLLQVKQLLLERLGSYLESETEVENFQLTRDEVTVLTAGIVKTEILSEQWDGKTYSLTAKIEADPEVVAESVKELQMSRTGKDEILKLESVNADALERIEELKSEMARVQKDLININRDYSSASKIVGAWDSYESGLQLFREGKYSDAITAFNSAIELEPKYVYFFQRGRVYMNLKNCDAAIKDFDRVISLNPDVKDAYFHRGRCLRRMGKKKEGSNEIRKAASMGSGNAKRWLKANRKREP